MLLLSGCTGTTESVIPPPGEEEEEELVTPTPAEFEVTSLDIEPLEVMAGETVTITAVVENTGGSEGTYTAILTVDGVTEDTEEVAITAGSSRVVTFSLVKDTLGTYEIGVGELSSTLIVKETAKIEVTFSPNSVPCEDGHWYWTLIVTEVNGIGVNIENMTRYIYGGDDNVVDTHSYGVSTMEEWWDSAYLLPHGSLSLRCGFPCQEILYEIVKVIGTDDNGNQITAEGRVDFLPDT